MELYFCSVKVILVGLWHWECLSYSITIYYNTIYIIVWLGQRLKC